MKKLLTILLAFLPHFAAAQMVVNGKKVGVARGTIQCELLREWAETHGADPEIVELDSQETESMRLALAKRRGEQAQTKILLPLTLLLGLVILILMAPAFLQLKNI